MSTRVRDIESYLRQHPEEKDRIARTLMFWDTPEAFPVEVQTPTGAKAEPLVLSEKQKQF